MELTNQSCPDCCRFEGSATTFLSLLKSREGNVIAIAALLLMSGWISHFLLPSASDWLYALSAVASLTLILKSALETLRAGKWNVDVLVGLAILASLYGGEYHAGAVVGVMLLGGGLLEQWTVARAERAVASLLVGLPKTALVRRDGREEEIPIEKVQVGDRVIVRAGERLPVDGVIVSGASSLDESTVTGESVPADKGPGDFAFAGTINLTGPLEIRCERVGDKTTYGQIKRLMEEARSRKAPIERLADRFAQWYVPLAIGTAGVVWWVTGEMIRAVTVLIVFCPCALVLATPTAIVAGIGRAAKRAILVKGGRAMEATAQVTLTAFDKTGTLTIGRPSVTCVTPLSELSEKEIVRLAASLERLSEHPFARAICAYARDQQDLWEQPSDFQVVPGKGVSGRVNGQTVAVGRLRWVGSFKEQDLESVLSVASRHEENGHTVLGVSVGGAVKGLICLQDTLRAEAGDAVRILKQQAVDLAILTGDNERVARSVASALGIPTYYAGLLPEEKPAFIENWRSAGIKVAFVGDGINDGPALAAADVGVAMGRSGTDIAVEVADLAFLTDDLRKMPEALHLAKRTVSVIRQNLFFSTVVNIGAIVAASQGWINPIWGAVIHEASAMIVILNAIRLLR
ncbi:MAG: cation-translocating P-type ATPase [Armatimonadetes bacterium]|nr:cation-translocating P-type ATPase [Armatimonadota bacterium]MDW8120783.1 cation-translocating P-type ATPase [Armatimonadota bacterium]